MDYRDFLRARSQSPPAPTLTRSNLTREQNELAAQGVCIQCRQAQAEKCSYICAQCLDKENGETVRAEIETLRRSILDSSCS